MKKFDILHLLLAMLVFLMFTIVFHEDKYRHRSMENKTQISPFASFLPVKGKLASYEIERLYYTASIFANDDDVITPISGRVYYAGQYKNKGFTAFIGNKDYFVIITGMESSKLLNNQDVDAGEQIGVAQLYSKVNLEVYVFNKANTQVKDENARKIRKIIGGEQISYQKFTELLTQLGAPKDDMTALFCIAKWESGLNPTAINYNNNNTIDTGLFQINSIWTKPCNTTREGLYDVTVNARCALKVLKQQGLTAWMTYDKYGRATSINCPKGNKNVPGAKPISAAEKAAAGAASDDDSGGSQVSEDDGSSA